MPRKCKISNTKTLFGNNRSHALNSNRRTFKVNLQSITLKNYSSKKIKVSSRELRSLRKKGLI